MNNILDNVIEIGRLVAPMIHPAAPAAIAIGERVVDMIQRLQDDGADDPRLAETREAIEARLHAKASGLADSLRG